MVIYSKVNELTEKMISLKSQNFSVGFVPTMGALHAGHLSLIDKAREECQIVVVSIFVNPIQFNNPEDLKTYPRTLDQDVEKIKDTADILFVPTVEEIYPTQPTESYHFGELENVMEGVQRPGHFNGVAIVVKKLLDIVQPDKAYFGEKDFQQLAIVKKLVEQCRINTTIIACPTIRESNGLAMSSRNQRLTNNQKEIAAKVYPILVKSTHLETTETKLIVDYVITEIEKIDQIKVEYFQIVDEISLQPVESILPNQGIVGCIAFYVGDVRLIDNIRYQ